MTKLTKRQRTALWIMFTPLGVLTLCAIGVTVANSILTATIFYNSDGFTDGLLHPAATIVPVTFFVLAAIGVVAFIPCLIIGSRMLRKKDSHAKD